ncbi:transposase family protein [Salinispora arenicola]|uniref:transposase family protein n=1 Tax=Salinispora arenicola TaxID=168697 RepID=UPI0003AADC12|nr:transposase family protein [Salinispora arenicola]
MSSCPIPVLSAVTGSPDAPAPAVTEGETAGLLHALSAVPDPRDPRGVRYPLSGLLAVAVCAVLAGASSFAAITDWLHDLDAQARDRLGFDRGVPVGTTVWRLLTRLDDGLLSTALAGWLTTRARPVSTPRPAPVPEADRRGRENPSRCPPPRRRSGHLLTAYDTSTGIVLAQVTIAAKSHEIPAFAPLLDAVETVLGSLTGLLFIADALHTQTVHAGRSRRPPDDPHERQPAHPVRPTQSPTMARDPTR